MRLCYVEYNGRVVKYWPLKGLSCMMGDYHVQFLGAKGLMALSYPVGLEFSMRKIADEKLAYLDTCVISGLAKNDLKTSESDAMVALLSAESSEVIRFVTSTSALDELSRIPDEHKTPHLAIYHLLEKVRALKEPSLTRMAPWGGSMGNPDRRIWSFTRTIVPAESDADHLYQAHQNNARFFVTVDHATILRYKTDIERDLDMIAFLPSELVEKREP